VSFCKMLRHCQPTKLLQIQQTESMQFDEKAHGSLSGALKKDSSVCKIADFGMARRMQGNRSYASDVRQGTPFYISPETINQHRLHRSSDVYAFGVIMWEMMRGMPVFVTYVAPCLT
jgi:serine/threonine protein kinase